MIIARADRLTALTDDQLDTVRHQAAACERIPQTAREMLRRRSTLRSNSGKVTAGIAWMIADDLIASVEVSA